MHKIFSVGMILLILSAWFSHIGFLPPKNDLDISFAKAEGASLFTSPELEPLSSQEFSPSQPEPLLPSLSLPPSERTDWKMELPISDESNDDFNLEPPLKDQSKKVQNFDIPIVINAKVEQFIQYFQTTGRNTFSNWLARSEKYIPIMKNLLKENGLPEDLVYLALIESGFNPYAYSRSKASGPWQFIYLTGKRYGLKVNWWVDERRDPEKSTIAAAKYLKDLYDMFACWYLAAAGYNAGEKKIANAMKRYRTEDFWELTKYRYLKQETKHYVPQMIAAALIAKDPEPYGFIGIEYQEPLHYEKVEVSPVTDLRLIAKACEISVEALKDLNPELLRWCTPPDNSSYEIKIPYGKRELFLKNFETLQPGQRCQFKTHIVKKGDTLFRIARSYRVDVAPILEINRLKRTTPLSTGMNLLIPIPIDGKNHPSVSEVMTHAVDQQKNRMNQAHERGEELHKKDGEKEIIYIVKEGDTLWSIAKKYNLTISEIKTWNHLDQTDQIYPTDRLKLKIGGIKSSTLN